MDEVYDAAEDDWDEDEDEATQYMIEQSLLESSKHTDSATRYMVQVNPTILNALIVCLMIETFCFDVPQQ